MPADKRNPVVHLELHTANLARACDFYTSLFDWRVERVHVGSGSYLALEFGNAVGGGVTECEIARPYWLPYVQVDHVGRATERGVRLGARVTLAPREGPAGWRSILRVPAGGEIALWQPKARPW